MTIVQLMGLYAEGGNVQGTFQFSTETRTGLMTVDFPEGRLTSHFGDDLVDLILSYLPSEKIS